MILQIWHKQGDHVRGEDHLFSFAFSSAWSCSQASKFGAKETVLYLTTSDCDFGGFLIWLFLYSLEIWWKICISLFLLMDFNESRIVTWQRNASWNVQAWKTACFPWEIDQGQIKHWDRCWWHKAEDCKSEWG